jgi:hypothetical protein
MNIAYLVFAYKNPMLLEKLIGHLCCERSGFFIHLDSKTPLAQFSQIRGPNVLVLQDRIPVHWAEFSGVEAIMRLIGEALASPRTYDYFVLLSGSEYPLQSSTYIHRFFEANRGSEFINLVKIPNELAGKPLSRIDTIRAPSSRPMLRFALRALAAFGLARRDHKNYLGRMQPYAGNTWWALSRDACEYVVRFCAENHTVVEYFRYTFAPEEMFIHSIIGNSHLVANVERNIVYEDWTSRGAHPSMIDERHLALFKENPKVIQNDVYGVGEALFARKVGDTDMQIIDAMDALLKAKAAGES